MPIGVHLLIAISYVGASIALAAVLVRAWRLEMSLAGLIALAVLLAAGLIHLALSQRSQAKQAHGEIVRLRSEIRQAHERLERTEARADALEDAMAREISERRRTLVTEMRGLEDMIARLGRSFESRMSEGKDNTGALPLAGAGALAAVRDALKENRVDLHLQPIVNLPQRRICFYEGFTRLRDAEGQVIMPATFLKAAAGAGLLGVIDNLLLFRCVQIVRRLTERDRRIGVFCNVAMGSLADEGYFPQFLEFMQENRELAGSLIFEVGLRDFNERNGVAARNIARLVDLGFRFSVDKGDTLAIDLPALQQSGVRFFKIGGRQLLTDLQTGGARPISSISREIAAEDVPAVFARYGVDLIAEKIEDEKTVVEILEFDIPYGQGHVFGPPRPIKGTLLEETAPPPEFLRRATGMRA
jgi:cyclic-di-GMP phosphodiesterase TipF (flagellum assembly factor)